MCGRYVVTSDTPSMYGLFSLPEPAPDEVEDIEPVNDTPRYNLAPTDQVPVVLERAAKDGSGVVRRLEQMRWGLVPSWAKDPSVGSRMFNARAESVPEKPAFKKAFQSRRALLPADGYYEWKKLGGTGKAAKKQPYFIHPGDGEIMAFAGLFEFWKSPEGEWLLSASVITTEAVGQLVDIHDRMPLVLPAADWDAWLNPDAAPADLVSLLAPPAADLVAQLELRPVSSRVGNVRNDDPSLIDRVDPEEPLSLI